MSAGRPNLFHYAYKELSQDAVICWLIACSAHAGDAELRKLGQRFVVALINKHEDCELKNIFSTEIIQQVSRIDVLVRINKKHVLLIEDKTDSNLHSNQLENYWNSVVGGKTNFGEVSESDLFAIYFKTGNQSLSSKRIIEDESQYKVFDRKDFLNVLNSYRGDNTIVLDLRCHLELMDRASEGFRNWKQTDNWKDWTRDAWEGLYMELEKRMCEGGVNEPLWWGWGHVYNPQGGFIGFWWTPPGLSRNCPAYLQTENCNLCFKIDAYFCSNERKQELKMEWNRRLIEQEDIAVRPKVLKIGKYMTVAVSRNGWLRFGDGGALNLDRTINSLHQAGEVLLNASCL